MPKRNTGIYIDEEVLDKNEEIRKAIEEQDEFGREIILSHIVEDLLEEWNEEHEHVLENNNSGNRIPLTAD